MTLKVCPAPMSALLIGAQLAPGKKGNEKPAIINLHEISIQKFQVPNRYYMEL